MTASLTSQERVRQVEEALPATRLREGAGWLLSPEAFPIDPKALHYLENLGQRLYVFQKACNLLYRQSVKGKQPEWIARWLDAGKPQEVIDLGRADHQKNLLPRVIRPDLLVTENGFALTEIDSVPGGLGVTSWLCRTYAGLGEDVIGGAEGFRETFLKTYPTEHIVIDQESISYLPEWEWLLGPERVKRAETYHFTPGQPTYRFFEMSDWMKLEGLRKSYSPEIVMDPPLKAFLEEKMWLALLWLKPLAEFWRRELGAAYFRDMLALVPQTWVVDPTELPPTAVLPGLEVQSWKEVMAFSQKQRELVLKVSGFSPLSWGSRGVEVGSDLSEVAWKEALEKSLDEFPKTPRILMKFAKTAVIDHLYSSREGEMKTMKGRVRLTPFYIVENERAHLQSVLATICPIDKKIIHGMQDAIMVPAKKVG